VPAQQLRAAKQWAVLWIVAIHTRLREGDFPALASDNIDIERGFPALTSDTMDI
jgi:hypothetical protein